MAKGANLAEMSRLGIPVPPGFTLTTEVCRRYHQHDGEYPAALAAQVEAHLKQLEELMGPELRKSGAAAARLRAQRRTGVHCRE